MSIIVKMNAKQAAEAVSEGRVDMIRLEIPMKYPSGWGRANAYWGLKNKFGCPTGGTLDDFIRAADDFLEELIFDVYVYALEEAQPDRLRPETETLGDEE